MPVYQVDIEKRIGQESWTNVWHINVADVAAAQSVAAMLVAQERDLHRTTVTFVGYRIRRTLPTPAPSLKFTSTGTGNVAPPSAPLPLFVVVRYDLPVADGTRPLRKYLRMPVGAIDINFDVFTAAFVNDMNTRMQGLRAAVPSLCDPQGTLVTGSAASPIVGMRQLRRGSKRRLQPVL